ncbi:MAG: hypothetical protein RLZ98_1923 [Pseudomonadota bacterium]|jgi:hypothetical protein
MFELLVSKKDLLAQLSSNRTLRGYGCSAEPDGARIVKITCAGKFHGRWRQTSSSYDWYPAGHFRPAYQTPSIEEAVKFMVRAMSSKAAA